MGQLEAPGAGADGAGEGALLVAEELALDEPLGDRRGVDGDEGAIPARTEFVDRPGDDLLAGPALPRDDRRRVAGGEELDGAEELAHRPALADEGPETGAVVEAGLEGAGLTPLRHVFRRGLEESPQLAVVQRFGQEVLRTALHRLDGGVDAPVGGDEDDRPARVVALEAPEEVEPGGAGEDDVGDDEVGRAAPDRGVGLVRVGCGDDVVAPVLDAHGEDLADRGLVVDHEDGQALLGHDSGGQAKVLEGRVPLGRGRARRVRAGSRELPGEAGPAPAGVANRSDSRRWRGRSRRRVVLS